MRLPFVLAALTAILTGVSAFGQASRPPDPVPPIPPVVTGNPSTQIASVTILQPAQGMPQHDQIPVVALVAGFPSGTAVTLQLQSPQGMGMGMPVAMVSSKVRADGVEYIAVWPAVGVTTATPATVVVSAGAIVAKQDITIQVSTAPGGGQNPNPNPVITLCDAAPLMQARKDILDAIHVLTVSVAPTTPTPDRATCTIVSTPTTYAKNAQGVADIGLSLRCPPLAMTPNKNGQIQVLR